jgi:predicted nucleic acid-binding protein
MKIIVDTSVWADHFRQPSSVLTEIGRSGKLRMHPFIVGEIAAGSLAQWDKTVAALKTIPTVPIVADNDFFDFMKDHRLMGSGLSFVDIHLLAAVKATATAVLWSRDKRLVAKSEELGCLFSP